MPYQTLFATFDRHNPTRALEHGRAYQEGRVSNDGRFKPLWSHPESVPSPSEESSVVDTIPAEHVSAYTCDELTALSSRWRTLSSQ